MVLGDYIFTKILAVDCSMISIDKTNVFFLATYGPFCKDASPVFKMIILLLKHTPNNSKICLPHESSLNLKMRSIETVYNILYIF